MLDLLTRETTKPDAAKAEPQPGRRVLLLDGEWRLCNDHYRFTAEIDLSPGGGAAGGMAWSVIEAVTVPAGFGWNEQVAGHLDGADLELACEGIDSKRLIRERYRFVLVGAEDVGVFQGQASVLTGGPWDARMSGTYRVETRRV